jgi:hypothetical protein
MAAAAMLISSLCLLISMAGSLVVFARSQQRHRRH